MVGGLLVQAKKYITNTAQLVVPVGDDSIAVVSSMGRFNIKGAGMSVAIMNILKRFETPRPFEDVISELSNMYSEASLARLLDLLQDKGILISEDDAKALSAFDKFFISRSFYYTAGGKSLTEVAQELASLSIGIIGPGQMVDCLLSHLSANRLLSNFHVGITDTEVDANTETTGEIVVTYRAPCSFDAIVEKSDLVVAACSYDNHFIFNQINELCFSQGKKWLRVVIEGANAEIGPLFVPGETCCYSCLCSRQRNNMPAQEHIFHDMYASEAFYTKTKTNPIAYSTIYQLNPLSASIASTEVIKHLTNMHCSLLNQVLTVSALDFHSQKDYIYKDHACPVCTHKDVVCV